MPAISGSRTRSITGRAWQPSTTRSAAAVMPRCASAATATAAPCAPSPTACCRWPAPCSNSRRCSTPPTRFARPPAREHPVPSLCSIENGHPFVPTCLLAERRAQRQSIGIGGHLAMPPLAHHRAYGSVPRRFGGLSTRQLFHGKQAQTTETRFSEGAMQSFREAQPTRSLWAEDSRTGRPFGDLEPTEFAIALTACLPLDPGDATQAPSDPAVQRWQFVPLAEAEVAGPTAHKRVEVGDHLFQADAPVPPRQLADPHFEPGHGLVA